MKLKKHFGWWDDAVTQATLLAIATGTRHRVFWNGVCWSVDQAAVPTASLNAGTGFYL